MTALAEAVPFLAAVAETQKRELCKVQKFAIWQFRIR
jgi:hypothetical protein